ncbi:hypothetical protein GLOTRDRAFT_65551 [Gloeophyllum trabeum ATCC 11539]|uniref:Zn(2)-C6 fungal-type domain-containing protein n=1 Tax=Gloeophyllum trabeum (strain ATCC 11539 / FP-39264 / Madison 617) TaxID=670483 RepID=S7PWL8_GLOTA|nr:uncharacterized protein GLOTRDRAFT_65551 [Gloeophyllum trabeum ATCC 11539]EPQ51953.1 hypothetical protein GLOTRDRAFT_65551 [Gloeophyllum trabeum ATCC 11539]
MSNHWGGPSSSSYNMHHYDLPALHDGRGMSFPDEYEDGDELSELPEPSMPQTAAQKKAEEKQIRRRSSKACDQCRKSKCKCERVGENEPCKNCVLLNTPCTFLGPSRKRGPPKGYIDAIEARLHQTEALVGILLSSTDSRARTLLDDLSSDPLAKEIINRVDNSPYGTKGRRRGADPAAGGANRTRHATRPPSGEQPTNGEQQAMQEALRSTHPSNEWQDQVTAKLHALGRGGGHGHGHSASFDESSLRDERDKRPSLTLFPPTSASQQRTSTTSPVDDRRQRRRSRSPASLSSPSPEAYGDMGSPSQLDESDDEEGLADAVGQLSLNEHEEVRYHSKVSGLHLLGVKERSDGRSEGGIWKFPSSRVWPPLPDNRLPTKQEEEFMTRLPDVATQEHLLDLYFTYVHTALPIIHKKKFLEDFKNHHMDSPQTQGSDTSSPVRTSPYSRRRRTVPALLLFAMFSIAARYSPNSDSPPPPQGAMWPAGDDYLEQAKQILDCTYASSRPTTVQALLLMGYREVGIGAMAQAWLYIGMAVRMAQDLGMHKSADKWQKSVGTLFGNWELQERKRIWYACIIMDKYVSTYIGRPLAIFGGDFDNGLPSEEEMEELEEWKPHSSEPFVRDEGEPLPPLTIAAPGRVISCFNATARLSIILSNVVQMIYPIRPKPGRYAEAQRLEKELDKWYLELPEHLRYDPASSKTPVPLPHILTLHMQYWCTGLLLHRPFIRHLTETRNKSPASDHQEEVDVRAISQKNYDMCVRAANYITSIVSVYLTNYCIKRSSVFLCYYIFTASIMHVTTLTAYPNDPQARKGLQKLADALEKMGVVWPSAARARELIHGSRAWASDGGHPQVEYSSYLRHKRPHDEGESIEPGHLPMVESALRQSYSPSSPLGYPSGVDMPSNDNMAYFSPFDRWSGDSGLSFSGTLSTSVLPQQYSTGLVDERVPPTMGRGQQQHDGHGNGRYPQFWNDYSTMGQLSSTSYVPVLPELSQPHHHQQQHTPTNTHSQQSPMYLHDQYHMFNNLPPSNP